MAKVPTKDRCLSGSCEKLEQLQAEVERLKEANKLLKDGLATYEEQGKKMRASLRRWCIANHIKFHDEGPDILLDN